MSEPKRCVPPWENKNRFNQKETATNIPEFLHGYAFGKFPETKKYHKFHDNGRFIKAMPKQTPITSGLFIRIFRMLSKLLTFAQVCHNCNKIGKTSAKFCVHCGAAQ